MFMVNRKFQPVLALIIVVIFFSQSCAGRAANPVKVSQSGDTKKACKTLRKESKQIKRNLKTMMLAVKSADKTRTLLLISGALLIVPWFFVDFTDADKVEANAQRARYNYLADIAAKRKCNYRVTKLKKFYFNDKGYKTINR
jgi:hypothetical protein